MGDATVDSEEITIFGADYTIKYHEALNLKEMRLSQNCADNIQIERSPILTSFVPLPCSDWSNLAFHLQKLDHALSL